VKFDEAVKTVLRGMLTSPFFLFRVEADRPSRALAGRRLRGGQPSLLLPVVLDADDALFGLAAIRAEDAGRPPHRDAPHAPGPKSRSFARNFASQWLHLSRLETTVRPDPKKFPEFTASLRDAMIDEARSTSGRSSGRTGAFSTSSRPTIRSSTKNSPALRDRRVAGPQMRKVKLTDPNRGGILGFAGS